MKGQALTIHGAATLVECVDTKMPEIISTHTHTKAICARAGERMLVVKTALEDKFRKAVLDLGYGIPKV